MATARAERPDVCDKLEDAIRDAWNAETTADPNGWSVDNPSWGQCAVTALLVQDALGGDLLRADVEEISHYWNRLEDGREIDLTREQFGSSISIPEGEIRSRDYVLSFATTRTRYAALRCEVQSRLVSRTK